jgi:hypothetical protein
LPVFQRPLTSQPSRESQSCHAERTIPHAICTLTFLRVKSTVRSSPSAALACPLLYVQLVRSKGVHDMDALYLGVTIVFFALSWGLIVLCEKL